MGEAGEVVDPMVAPEMASRWCSGYPSADGPRQVIRRPVQQSGAARRLDLRERWRHPTCRRRPLVPWRRLVLTVESAGIARGAAAWVTCTVYPHLADAPECS
jgi:hypothetical protein